MRTTILTTTLLALLHVGSSTAAPAGQQCVVAHTPGGDDHGNVVTAFNNCKTGGTVVFSAGTDYQVLTPIKATGLSNVDIVIDGNVTFPYNNAQWDPKLEYWQIAGNDVHISGTGSITADGQLWWDNQPSGGPSVMVINVHNGSLSGITITQARAGHLKISFSSSFEVANITASSVSSSANPAKNTDGIDVSGSTGVYIHDSTIINGDDAIALEGGADGVEIRRVHCGGWCHGVSIGSLGPPGKANGSIASVQNVWVEDVSFEGCSTAIHIKSWPSSVQGWANNITYKNVALNNVGYAINFDQNYFAKDCKGCQRDHSLIQFENITIEGVSGTSTLGNYFDFSELAPAKNIVIEDISVVTPANKSAPITCNSTSRSQFGPAVVCP
ncbi:pectin lyase fold/virulence factor [Blyttiomyces helicus]|uniref:Pectin lyase fold/virulence factor n=1 Tax=Blyttiomyces helicus TaxID=388810 RepID=A0A4P9WAI4_9FUNG|nr:pectin lyase fold/virulence factor [Blyttiomyces helicus]|eukprot:RKO89454.1 pectin lyase fold/virulence factor [Blyttiomyces helicus]